MRVPTLNIPRVQQAQAPQQRLTDGGANLDSFGGGETTMRRLASSADAGKAAMEQIGLEIRRANTAKVFSADSELSAFETELLHHPTNGVLNQRGELSFQTPEKTRELYKKKVDELEKNFSNDEQRSAFRVAADSRYNDIHKKVYQHVSGQLKSYEDEAVESFIANERNAAALSYNDPERVALALDRQQNAIYTHAKNNGLSNEYIKLKIQEAASETHTNVIERMLAGGMDKDAKEYFETVREDFTGKDIKKIEEALHEGWLRGEGMRVSDSIIAKSGTLDQAYKQARQIEDPEVRLKATDYIKDHFAMKKRAEDERDDRLFEAAARYAEERKEPPPGLMVALKYKDRKIINDILKGKGTETDWETYYGFQKMAKDEFKNVNLLRYKTKLADAEFKELTRLQKDLRSGSKGAEKILDGWRTDSMIVADALKNVGIKTDAKPGTKDAQRAALFRRKVDEEVMVMQERTGKKASNKEIQAIVDELTIKGTVPNSGFMGFFQKQKFEFERGDNEQLEIDVPDEEREKIARSLERNNQEPSDENILKIFMKKRGKKDARY